MSDAHVNFGATLIAAVNGVNPQTATSVDVTTGEGQYLPKPPFNAVVWPANQKPTRANAEIVRVTARAGDTLTITRAQEGTNPISIAVGYQLANMVTVKTLTDLETPLEVAKRIGSITFIGHSYIAGTTQSDSGTSNVWQESITARLQALLGVTQENINFLGVAATGLTGLGLSSPWAGWRAVLQFCVPAVAAVSAPTDVIRDDPTTGTGGAVVIVHGINDLTRGLSSAGQESLEWLAKNINAYKHSLRVVLSRTRAGVLYSSVMAPQTPGTMSWATSGPGGGAVATFTGSWSTDTQNFGVSQNSGAGYKSTTTNGDSFTITLPQNFTGGIVAICLLAQGNAVTRVASAMDATQTSMTVVSSSNFPSAPFVAAFSDSSEEVLVTAISGTTWTITRNINGAGATTHAANARVWIATDTHRVDWSGTASAASGSTYLGGQGNNNLFDQAIVKRFVLTGNDAGKTITGTLVKPYTSDTAAALKFDSWWIETKTPPPTVVTNVHEYEYKNNGAGFSIAAWSGDPNNPTWFNYATTSVVAEFAESDGSNWVQVADVWTPSHERAGKIGGSGFTMNATDTTTANVPFIANSSAWAPTVGALVAAGYTSTAPELMIVQAVSGSHPNYTLTLLRGALGSTKQTHATDDWLGAADWMHTDGLHLSNLGHAAYADHIYRAFSRMPKPVDYQMAAVQGAWTQYSRDWITGIADDEWIFVPTGTLGTGATTLNQQFFAPFYVQRLCILTGIGVEVTTAIASGKCRLGIYYPDSSHTKPGRLIADFGQVDTSTTGYKVATNCYQLLRPGWYWLSGVSQGAAATYRVIAGAGMTWPPLPVGNALPTVSASTVNGFQSVSTSISGTLADAGAVQPIFGAAPKVLPRFIVKLRAPMFS